MCAQLDGSNMHLSGLIAILDKDLPNIPTQTEDQAAVMGGIGAYCPDYVNQIRQS
jgi:hypothetical protein